MPPFPNAGNHLWLWFMDLCRSRSASGFGPQGIPYTELKAWSSLNGIKLAPWEVETLRALDAAYLAASAKMKGTENGS